MTDTLLGLPAAETPQEPAPGLTADHMTQMLRRHYLPEGRQPGGIFAPEIGSPCGRRRADLIWMPTTIAGGNRLHGHEIKVSRADLVAELTDPAKADPWAQYCTYWWLVVAHPSLISGLAIPEVWGVMAPPSGRRTRSMTVVKEAPKLTPQNPAPAYARIAAWQMYATSGRITELEREVGWRKTEMEQLRADVAELRASGGGTGWDDKRTKRITSIVAAIERRLTEVDGGWWRLQDIADGDIVDAVVDHTAARRAAGAMRRQMAMLVRDVERITAEPFGYALKELRKAEKVADQVVEPRPETSQ